jgi:hypothetical protein
MFFSPKVAPEDIVPTKESTASEWILWHKALKSAHLGKGTANSLWLKGWRLRGCSGIGCTANTAQLREYAESQGFTVNGGVLDFVPDAIDNFSDFTSKAFNLGFYTVLAIVAILVAFLGLLAYNIGRNPQMIVDAGKAYTNATSARAITGSATIGGKAV